MTRFLLISIGSSKILILLIFKPNILQGISGILADEMGLGKTVQCIAFLCHVAERLGVWGPFLVVSPASTLHNWQQEMERFVPDFKVVRIKIQSRFSLCFE